MPNGVPHGHIPESSSLAGPPLPRPPQSPDWGTLGIKWDRDQQGVPRMSEKDDVIIPPRPHYIQRREDAQPVTDAHNGGGRTNHSHDVSARDTISLNDSFRSQGSSNRSRRSSSYTDANASISSVNGLGLVMEDSPPPPQPAEPLVASLQPIPTTAVSSQESVSSSQYNPAGRLEALRVPTTRPNRNSGASTLSTLSGFEVLSVPPGTEGSARGSMASEASAAEAERQRRQLLDRLLNDPTTSSRTNTTVDARSGITPYGNRMPARADVEDTRRVHTNIRQQAPIAAPNEPSATPSSADLSRSSRTPVRSQTYPNLSAVRHIHPLTEAQSPEPTPTRTHPSAPMLSPTQTQRQGSRTPHQTPTRSRTMSTHGTSEQSWTTQRSRVASVSTGMLYPPQYPNGYASPAAIEAWSRAAGVPTRTPPRSRHAPTRRSQDPVVYVESSS
ncbi:hypothetical protein BD410DRAFT_841414 [Rickenella mellea]|uniref:Uncharacterized protein n=1 Tax=Rickenella mellea TaxID=50990 RepID=A0A4Y7PY31_9AGAM|nr:hypothetical protein BD410DRAFT_841414 [Rickenella mellea]